MKKDDPNELSYIVMDRAENGECVIDNTKDQYLDND